MLKSLKKIYNKHIDKQYITYILIILLLILLVLFAYKIYDIHFSHKLKCEKICNSKGKIGITLDDKYFYVIDKHTITKHKQKNGQKILHKKYPITIYNAKYIKGDIVIVSKNNNGIPTLIWVDSNDLNIADTLELPFIDGDIKWVDNVLGRWWVCTSLDNNLSHIYCFNEDWVPEGFWKISKEKDIWSGLILGDQACITVKDKKELLLKLLTLPSEKVNTKTVQTMKIPFDAKSFDIQFKKHNNYIWGIKGNNIMKCEINEFL